LSKSGTFLEKNVPIWTFFIKFGLFLAKMTPGGFEPTRQLGGEVRRQAALNAGLFSPFSLVNFTSFSPFFDKFGHLALFLPVLARFSLFSPIILKAPKMQIFAFF